MLIAVIVRQFVASSGDKDSVFDRYRRRWCRGLLTVLGVRLSVVGATPLPPARARLVVANHRSALDIPAILAPLGGAVLSRSDISEWPLIGQAARRAQTIFVDRDCTSSRAAAVRAIRRHLQAGGTVCVFPEGTTHCGDEVHRFSKGVFSAAEGLDVETVMVGFAYPPGSEFAPGRSFVEHGKEIVRRRQTHIGMCIHPPVVLTGSPAEKAEKARGIVQDLVLKARAHTGPWPAAGPAYESGLNPRRSGTA